jgi:hypothetical protein
MFTRPASIAAVFTVACAAAGCTTTEPTTITADSTPPIAAADFGPQLASTLCAVWVRCGLYEEMAECVAASPGASSFRPSDVAADIANGTLDYEGSLAADCIDKIAATACSDVALNPDFDWLVTAECGQFMLGTLSDGSACTRDEQCGVNSNCLPDPNGPSSGIDLPGTCTPIDNRICGPDNPPCPGNEVCAPGGVCGGDGGAGSSCGDDIDCVKGLVCTGLVDAYGPTGNGTCVPPPGAGASCDGVCDALGLSCVVVGQTEYYQAITQCLPDADRGQACSRPGDVFPAPYCKRDSICDIFTNVCVDAARCNPISHACTPLGE